MTNELANNAINNMTRDQKVAIVRENTIGFDELGSSESELAVDSYFDNMSEEEKKMLVGIE